MKYRIPYQQEKQVNVHFILRFSEYNVLFQHIIGPSIRGPFK